MDIPPMASAKSIVKRRGFWVTAVTGACVAAIGIGAVAGDRTLDWYAGKARSTTPAVVFEWPVYDGATPGPDGVVRTWMPVQVQEQLVAAATEHMNGNVMDRAALTRAADALRATGWFTSIDRVEREDGGVVRIAGQWRVPVAVVRVFDTDRLVTQAGELLPVDYPANTSKLRVVTNASRPAPGVFGEAWEGGDVQAGLELLAMLHGTPIWSQVAGVDVAEYAGKKRLTLVTDLGNRVVWGAWPENASFAEPTVEVKLGWLKRLKAGGEFGKRIDANRPVVDVSNPRGIMVDQSVVAGPVIEPETPEESVPPPKPAKKITRGR